MANHRASSVFSPYRCCASFASIVSLVVAQFVSVAAWACGENAIIVFDASGSMALVCDGQSKMVSVGRAAREVLPNLTRKKPTGRVTYCGWKGLACEDVSLRLGPAQAVAWRQNRILIGSSPIDRRPCLPQSNLRSTP